MQASDVASFAAPLGAEARKIHVPIAIAVADDTIVPVRRHDEESRLTADDLYANVVIRCVEIPVLGKDGEVTGVLCSRVPIAVAPCLKPLRKKRRTIVDAATRSVVHDLINVLASIDCGLRLLDRQTETTKRRVIVERMRHAIMRGVRQSRELLSKNDATLAGRESIVSREDLIMAAEELRHAVEPGQSLRVDIAQDLSSFVAETGDLFFALLNLCRNASAAMQDDGEVVISARNIPHAGEMPSSAVEIIVADNGSGMPEDVLRRAFEINYTTKRAGDGSGLGLGQVKQFVEKNAGSVDIETCAGFGTAVRMRLLPISREADPDVVVIADLLNGSDQAAVTLI